jgi:hypothetical protein
MPMTPMAEASPPPAPELRLRIDPTEWALRESAWRRELPRAFCPEVGRRMFLAQLQFSEWILRRVEKVQFDRDRSMSRSITIDLLVRADAPVFVDNEGNEFWLLPLSSMRRRTLVNLSIRDEAGDPMTMPGIRLTQQLDQAMLLAAAATVRRSCGTDDAEIRTFARRFVAGELADVVAATRSYRGQDGPVPQSLAALSASPAFDVLIDRLRHNFTLYVLLPVTAGRHRVITVAFDEPTDWRYKTSDLVAEPDGSWSYRGAASTVPRRERSQLLASFALKPTRLRLQTPGAENAASYHFEIVAPHGLRIVEATLLAARPNDSGRHLSEDRVVGHAPVVGLHAVEVPNGSLCRVQVDLRIPARGWLTTLVVSCAAVFCVLLSILFHLTVRQLRWEDPQVTNIVLLLVSTAAGVATLLSQRDFGGVAGRMVSRLKGLGAVSTSLPILAAGFLAYASYPLDPAHLREDRWAIGGLTATAFSIFLITLVAWAGSRRSERAEVVRESPWDMTVELRPRPADNFWSAQERYGFGSPAVAIRSAEGWHERYAWRDDLQKEVTARLAAPGPSQAPGLGACAIVGDTCPVQNPGCGGQDGDGATAASRARQVYWSTRELPSSP